jgi:hypothetical protein
VAPVGILGALEPRMHIEELAEAIGRFRVEDDLVEDVLSAFTRGDAWPGFRAR